MTLQVRQAGVRRFGDLVFRSARMGGVVDEACRVAPSRLPLLLTGPSGTGKTRFAEAVHRASGRTGSFEVVDCAGGDPALFRADLLGATRGAYTGCDRDRAGAFERADGGTLFLDEVGELTGAAQASLLKVVEEQQVRRLGAQRPVSVTVRVIAATLQRPDVLRSDLLHRLGGVRLELPSLAARPEDIEPIVEQRLESEHPGVKVARAAMRAHQDRAWPGNVRELLHAVDRAAARARAGWIELDALMADDPPSPQPLEVALDTALRRPGATLRDVERSIGVTESVVLERVRALLGAALAGRSEREAARHLGWPRTTVRDRRRLCTSGGRAIEGWTSEVDVGDPLHREDGR